jgi:CheY-like chemotaxis protein
MPKQILVVDDEVAMRQFIQAVLPASEYSILESSNGLEALRLLQQFKAELDLLLTDVIMPQMGGRELAAHLRLERPDLKVLFISGYDGDLIGSLEEGMDFLRKPFNVQTLRKKVSELIG